MAFRIKLAHLSLILVGMLHCASAQAEDASLPGGATTLREAHGDWSVTCTIQSRPDGESQKVCALSQEQSQAQSRQRVLAVELRPQDSGVKGTLVLPFGLSLKQGVAYQLDEASTGTPQRFRTCLPVGCLVDVAFDANTIISLKAGRVLKIHAIADGGQKITLSLSLAGFSSAYHRVVELLK